MTTFIQTMMKRFWGNEEEAAVMNPAQYIWDSNLGEWRDTRYTYYYPEFTGSMPSMMDSNEGYDFSNARCEFLSMSSSLSGIQLQEELPPFDPRRRQSLPYGRRKPPNQLGWIEWIYLLLTV